MTRLGHLPILLAAALAAICTGCSSGPNSAGTKTSEDLHAAAADVGDTRARADAALRSLNELMATTSGDLRPKYTAFSKAVDDLGESAKRTNDRANAMQKQGDAYFKHWDEESAKIKNEDIKARSAQRAAEVKAEFQQISSLYQEAKASFTPFYSNLKDLRAALGNDLTVNGLNSVRDIAARAQTDGLRLQATSDALAAQFRALGALLAPTAPAPAK